MHFPGKQTRPLLAKCAVDLPKANKITFKLHQENVDLNDFILFFFDLWSERHQQQKRSFLEMANDEVQFDYLFVWICVCINIYI